MAKNVHMPQPGYGQSPEMQAPLMQGMGREQLSAVEGVSVVQVAQWGEFAAQAVGIPWEAKNKYAVHALPPGGKAAMQLPAHWTPSLDELQQGQSLMYIVEESNACLRCLLTCCGGLNLRALRLHFYQHQQERYRVDRPCRLGGGLCCPLEMTLMDTATQRTVGMVQEDYDSYCGRCCDSCCAFTHFHKVLRADTGPAGQSLQQRYTLRVNTACCGRVDNFCGATCCKNDMVFDVLDMQGNVAATVQKTYAPTSDCGAFCRMSGQFSNYIISFPADASEEDRALLLAVLMQADYAHFEKRGGDNNNN